MAKSSSGSMSFLQHLEVLRWHLVRSTAAIFLFGGIAFFAKSILFDQIIFGPKNPHFVTYRIFCEVTTALTGKGLFCMDALPFQILNTKMAGQFSIHIWVSLIAGFIVAFPYLIWEMWRFIKPGLHSTERKYSRGVLFFGAILFAIGVLFGYYIIAPLSIQFLGTYSVSADVTNFIDLSSYITTVSTVTLACGLIFELPVLVYFLAKIGLLTPDWMRKYRKHSFVVILVLSAIITPPDITSQVLVTLPIVVLYEISIRICARVVKKQEKALAKTD